MTAPVPPPPVSRFAGSLVGQCLGDALGFPVEGARAERCAEHLAAHLGAPPHSIPPSGGYPPGQYTDDSQLARELMRSYAACRGFDPADYARRIEELFRTNRVVGRGMACDLAAYRLGEGARWDESGVPAPMAGNGTAMRAGPVGLLFGDDPDRMAQVAHDQGRITHLDPRCSAGSCVIAGAVALALRPGPVAPADWLATLSVAALPWDRDFAEDILRLEVWLGQEPAEAAKEIPYRGYEPGEGPDWPGISPFVVPSVLWSLYAFLRTPDDYLETIRTAIRVGGDVDTLGAMAGAISGARLGLEGLPADLVRLVNDHGGWGYDELVALAGECHAIKFGAGT